MNGSRASQLRVGNTEVSLSRTERVLTLHKAHKMGNPLGHHLIG